MSKIKIESTQQTLQNLVNIAAKLDPYGFFLDRPELINITKQISEQTEAQENNNEN